MKLKTLLCLVFLLFSIGMINAQDIHFSQFNLSPMTMNPAKAGAFKGTARIGGIYRDQWGSLIENQFRTPSFYIDAPISRGFRRKDWIGVGVHFLNDQSGTYNYQQTNIGGALAYHLALDPMRKNILTFGGQVSQMQRRADGTALTYADQYTPGTGKFLDPTNEAGLLENVSYLDYAAGVDFRSRPSANLSWNLGASMFHITEPESSGLMTGSTSTVPQKIVAHASATFALNQAWQLTPQAFFATQAGTNEIIAQAIAGYKMGENGDVVLNMGLGYRVNDAAMVLAGIEFKNLVVGVAYDFNVSPLSTYSNYQGGFEIGVGYIIRIPKTPTIPPVIFNPRT
jgi:type IX secretion system PorP/SprF family membrane protein